MSQSLENGWFKKNSFSSKDLGKNETALTHLIGYTLVGLIEIYRLKNANCEYEFIFERLNKAADNLIKFYNIKEENEARYNFSGFPGYFDSNWNSKSKWSCLTGNTQIEYFLRQLYIFNQNSSLLELANKINLETKKLHIIDNYKDENLEGALFGSDPIQGDYCPYQIPNWGVKFFADSLIKKIGINNDNYCIG
jgi:hypothetical protein